MGAAGYERQVEGRPAEAKSVAAPCADLGAEQIRRPLSPGYLVALLLITPFLLLLPLIYLGIIALAAYGTYYHAIEHLTVLEGRFIAGRLVLYVGPIVGGVAIVLFMLKPFFARPVHHESLFTLDRTQEPRFYELVDRIAAAVGAPQPGSIEIECIPNASASFRRGMIGLVRRDLVLHVGMPLVACMNARQFAGIVAHELGHFSQGMGMTLTYLVRVINGWFARMVYERDTWDERLDALGQVGDNALIWSTVAIGRLCVWLVRRVLWIQMKVAHIVSCHVVRQMEFDADACEAVIVGSDAFAETQVLMDEVNSAFGHAASHLEDFRAQGQLPDDLPAYVAATLQSMPAQIRAALDAQRQDERTRFFDTHPASRARIERAMRLNQPGVFQDVSPAARLFTNFPLLCRWATLGFYREYLGFTDAAERLAPASKLIERLRLESAGTEAVQRYFKDIIHPMHFSFADGRIEAALRAPGDLRERVRKARRRVEALAPAAENAIKALDEAIDGWTAALTAGTLIAAKYKVHAQSYGLERSTPEAAKKRERECFERIEKCLGGLRPFDEAAADRIGAALAVLVRNAQRSDAGAAKLTRHAQRLRDAMRAFDDVQLVVLDLTRIIVQMRALFEHPGSSIEDDAVQERFNILARDGQSGLHQLSRILASVEHPFAKGQPRLTIAQTVIEVPPDLPNVPPAISTACGRLSDLRLECLGRLALIAEKAERAVASART